MGSAIFPVGVLCAEEDRGGREDGRRGVEREEIGDDEEVDAGVESEGVEVQEGVEVGEGGGEVEVHFCGDADEAAGAGGREGRHFFSGGVVTVVVVVVVVVGMGWIYGWVVMVVRVRVRVLGCGVLTDVWRVGLGWGLVGAMSGCGRWGGYWARGHWMETLWEGG